MTPWQQLPNYWIRKEGRKEGRTSYIHTYIHTGTYINNIKPYIYYTMTNTKTTALLCLCFAFALAGSMRKQVRFEATVCWMHHRELSRALWFTIAIVSAILSGVGANTRTYPPTNQPHKHKQSTNQNKQTNTQQEQSNETLHWLAVQYVFGKCYAMVNETLHFYTEVSISTLTCSPIRIWQMLCYCKLIWCI